MASGTDHRNRVGERPERPAAGARHVVVERGRRSSPGFGDDRGRAGRDAVVCRVPGRLLDGRPSPRSSRRPWHSHCRLRSGWPTARRRARRPRSRRRASPRARSRARDASTRSSCGASCSATTGVRSSTPWSPYSAPRANPSTGAAPTTRAATRWYFPAPAATSSCRRRRDGLPGPRSSSSPTRPPSSTSGSPNRSPCAARSQQGADPSSRRSCPSPGPRASRSRPCAPTRRATTRHRCRRPVATSSRWWTHTRSGCGLAKSRSSPPSPTPSTSTSRPTTVSVSARHVLPGVGL